LSFASGYDEVLVIEHKRAFVEAQLGRMLLNLNDLSGKPEPVSGASLLSEQGELNPTQFAAAITARCQVLQVAGLKPPGARVTLLGLQPKRSEERRVGQACRSQCATHH